MDQAPGDPDTSDDHFHDTERTVWIVPHHAVPESRSPRGHRAARWRWKTAIYLRKSQAVDSPLAVRLRNDRFRYVLSE